MPALVVDRNEAGFTVQITVPYNPSMLDFEEALQQQPRAGQGEWTMPRGWRRRSRSAAG
jgi:hypothetical protein